MIRLQHIFVLIKCLRVSFSFSNSIYTYWLLHRVKSVGLCFFVERERFLLFHFMFKIVNPSAIEQAFVHEVSCTAF